MKDVLGGTVTQSTDKEEGRTEREEGRVAVRASWCENDMNDTKGSAPD